MQIYRHLLKTTHFEVAALSFHPKNATNKVSAIFTHGYTSHKGAILSWAEKLYHAQISSLIFDLPGHLLGSASEVIDLDIFSNEAAQLFKQAVHTLEKIQATEEFIVGGHSLGALLALKYLRDNTTHKCHAIGVGFADAVQSGNHIYQDPLFEKMLEFRSLLVSPTLHHSAFFPWIKKEKENLQLQQQDILFLSGKDDLVAKASDVERLALRLREQNNQVELKIVDKLPHHEPEKAATLIRDHIKTKFNL